MNTPVLIWADSEVTEVCMAEGRLTLRLAAAHVQQQDLAGQPEWGHLSGVVVHGEGLDGSRAGPVPDALGRLSEGRWLIDGSPLGPWPLDTPLLGALRLELRFANGTELVVHATRARAECLPEARFRPSLAC
jgi:hypothetical protein